MSYWVALLLGLVQGVAEFLPISSSGHLHIVENLLGLHQLGSLLFFDLWCHLGTALALLIFFYRDCTNLLFHERKKAFLLILALLPLVPAYLFLKKPISVFFQSTNLLGLFFIFSGIILRIAHHQKTTTYSWNRKKDVLVVGVFQSLALIPGVSRLGSTITAGRLMGWDTKTAAQFSFLLAIPTVIGGVVLETKKLYSHPEMLPAISPICYLIGFGVSFMVGTWVLRWFMRYLEKGSLKPFSYYLIVVGSIVTMRWILG